MLRIFSMKVTGQDFTAPAWAGYLSGTRLEEAEKRKNPDERQLFLGAEALLNRSLERSGIQCPLPAVYGRNAHGKPFLMEAQGIYVNWSHSGEYVLCAVADSEVGVDLQKAAKAPGEHLIRRFLQVREREDYEREPARRQRLFYEYWALKESFLKALGTGFAAPLEGFWIEWEHGAPRIVQQLNEKKYQCRVLEFPDPDYAAAVCWESAGSPEPAAIEFIS